MKRSDLFQNLVTGILVVCALVTTVVLVRREFFSDSGRGPARPRVVPEWRDYAAAGHRAGPKGAPVTMVEFSDFQCPFCAVLAARLDSLREEHPQEVAVLYRHAPLSIHEHAVAAAVASECAAEQGRFWEFHDALFQEQDSIGRAPWRAYATAAGVPRLPEFERCLQRAGGHPALQADTLAAAELDVTGTPTLLINQHHMVGAPTMDTLRAYVRRALAEAKSRGAR